MTQVVVLEGWWKVKLFLNMRLTETLVRRLVVKTVSGTVLGKIKSFEMESEDQMITHYTVVSSLLRSKQYLVNRGQVRSITMTEMIVDDAVARQTRPVRRRLLPRTDLEALV